MLCLTAGTVTAMLALSSFTLAWTHSIEKVRWEEDWHVAKGRLVLSEARIRSSGAGMEPPTDAVLKNGVWHYRPTLAPQAQLRLAHSPYAGGYELCHNEACTPLAQHLSNIENAVVELRACP